MSQFQEDMFLIFGGLFQNSYVADNLAVMVDHAVEHPDQYFSLKALSPFMHYTQVFCDFAGYSCIARGVSKSLGFELMIKFKEPLFSQNPR